MENLKRTSRQYFRFVYALLLGLKLREESPAEGSAGTELGLGRWLLMLLVGAAVAASIGTSALAQQKYTITDLGVVPIVNGTASGDTDASAKAINNKGTVVGLSGQFGWAEQDGYLYDITYCSPYTNSAYYNKNEGVCGSFDTDHAFLWTPSSTNVSTGVISYLGGLPGDYCYKPESTVGGFTTPASYGTSPTAASDINSAGQAVGYSWTAPDGLCTSLQIHGALWQNGIAVDLGLPGGISSSPGAQSYGTNINDAGQIVGYLLGDTADVWLYDGSYHMLGSLPGFPYALPSKINKNGTVVGTASSSSQTLGFVHTGTGPIQASDAIGTLGGPPNSAAYGINDAGWVVGSSSVNSTDSSYLVSHAFVINPMGQMRDLGTASADTLANSLANAINNNANDIVGWSNVAPGTAWQSSQHAVLWPGGNGIVDLNTLLPPDHAPPADKSALATDNPMRWELTTATSINNVGQIVGTGLLNGNLHAFLLNPTCATQGGDTDGDGLCDDWETNGYTAPDGTFVDLPAMGADPKHKDIFVQTDYMVAGGGCDPIGFCVVGHSHQPNPDAIAMVTAAFANAPVNNPDGKTGITLHVDCGVGCVMNPLTGQTWGALSQAHGMPEAEILGYTEKCIPPGSTTLTDCYNWDDFAGIAVANFSKSRWPIFHYSLFAHELGIYASPGMPALITGSSALGAVPGSGFIVSLGGYTGEVGTSLNQAGTFMHELGHNLGLNHGGLDTTNYKPNYLSVMNYSFQFDGLIQGGIDGLLDYSKFPSIPPLNQLILNESVGLNGGPDLADYGTAYYCPGAMPVAEPGDSIGRRDVGDANGPIDWNCDGSIEADVAADISAAKEQTPLPLSTFLTSSDDWDHLIYNGGAIGGMGAASPFSQPTTAPVLEGPVADDSVAPYLVSVVSVSPGIAQVYPGSSLNLTFSINNRGLQADTYTITATSTSSDWWQSSAIPATVTLAGGASQQIVIPLTVSGCFSTGTQGQFTIKAVSQSKPSIADSSFAQLTVLPAAAGSVAIPSVVGLTQSFAETYIQAAGFVVGTVTSQSSPTVPAGSVISQAPASCGLVAPGTMISIVVSSGPELIAVPNVAGDMLTAALAAINGAGLTTGSITTVPSSTIPAGNVISQSPAAGSHVSPGSPISLTIASIQLDVVPNVVGSPIAAAISEIDQAGFSLDTTNSMFSATVPAGTVLSQFPAAATMALPGSAVSVVVSSGSSSYGVVPNVLGETGSAATSAILSAGLSLGAVALSSSTTVPKGDVIGQNPLPGVTAFSGTGVSLNISAGPQPYVAPNLYGLPQAAATSAITAAGLTVGTITPYPWTLVPPGYVFQQSPVAGSYVSAGTPVGIYVATASSTVLVPDLSATNYIGAALAITQAGLTLGTLTPQSSSTVSQGLVISQSPAAGTSLPAGSPVNVLYSAGSRLFTVPNVVGESQTSASTDIANAFFYDAVTRQPSMTVPDGEVISQSPAASSEALVYSTITLVVSSGGSVTATAPNVAGMFGSQAEQTLFAAGFAVGSISTQPSTQVAAAHVISQNPAAGASAPWDTSVSLVFSSGLPATVTVPHLVGLTQTAAITALNSASLAWTITTQTSPTIPTGDVISQNPPAGVTLLAVDRSVSFVVSAGSSSVPTYTYLAQFGDFGAYNAVNGQFVAAVSIAVDPSNRDILVGDESGRVQIFDSNGNFKSYFGGEGVNWSSTTGSGNLPYNFYFGGSAQNGLFAGHVVSGIVVDPINHNIVAVDSLAERVLIFNSAGVFQSSFGSPGLEAGQFGFNNALAFAGVAIDPVTENILVSDTANNRVQVFNSAGVYLSQFGTYGGGDGQFGDGPAGIAIDPTTRNIVVADSGTNRVQIFDHTGAYLTQFGTPGAGNGSFYEPQGVAIDPATHDIVVSARGIAGAPEPYLQVFSSTGMYLSQFGGQIHTDQNGFTSPTFFSVGSALGLAIDPVSHNLLSLGSTSHVEIFGAVSPPAAPAVALISSANPTVAGQPVTFTATVTGNGPTGTIQFLNGDTGLGAPVALVGGAAALTTSTLPVGTDSITAVYGGDINNAASTSPLLNETITAGATTTAVVASANPITAGHSVTFTATVMGNSPSGTVEFFNGSRSLGSAVSLTAAMATLTTSDLPVGTDSITAVYSGDELNAAGTSPILSETVSPAGSTTSLLTSSAEVIAGQPVTLTAIVSGDSPTGTIQFMNGAASLGGPVTMTRGTATLTTSSLRVGSNSLTAVYSGDSLNMASTSAPLDEVILATGTATTMISSSINPGALGQPVTFAATVTGSSPTGTVQFLDGAASIGGPIALTGGAAILTTSSLSAGTHSMTAVYSGDSSNTTSTSPPLSEVITRAPTTTVVTTSLNPAPAGQSITFTASVTGSSPTRGVEFWDGANSLGTPVTLAAGATTFTTSSLSPGTHSIMAAYGGDASNAKSASAVLSEVITIKAATTTTVASSLNPAIAGQQITFTATVTGSSPTGTVQFLDGAASLGGAVTLASGMARLTTSSLSIGTHPITAVYSGDGSNATSTSAVLSEVISRAATPPAVTAPASISIPATQAGGATGSASPALAAFLAGATAVSTVSPAPTQLAPQVGGVSVTSATLFPIGTTTVTFRFQDANGNIGSATSTATVTIGTPRITGSIAGVGTDPSGAIYVNIVLTNTGTGNARNLKITTLVFRTLSGTGTVTYNSTLSPSLPIAIGNLDVGAAVTTRVYLKVPGTATRISVTENGTVQDVLGTNYNYSTAEALVP